MDHPQGGHVILNQSVYTTESDHEDPLIVRISVIGVLIMMLGMGLIMPFLSAL